MPRRSEEPPDPIEQLTQEVIGLSREVQVLRETLDEIREYLQWITRNTDQFPIMVQLASSRKENMAEPGQEPKGESNANRQGLLFD